MFGSPPYLCDDPEKQERDAPSHRGVRIIGHDGGRRAGRQVGGVGAVIGGVGYSHGVVQHDEEEDEDACRDCKGRAATGSHGRRGRREVGSRSSRFKDAGQRTNGALRRECMRWSSPWCKQHGSQDGDSSVPSPRDPQKPASSPSCTNRHQ